MERNGVARVVPTQVKRTAGVKANFLCDTASYIFGVDAKGKPDRAFRCFEASRVIHAQILNNVGSVVARAILAYYSSWNPGDSSTLQCLEAEFENACTGGNVTFAVLSDGGSLLLAEEDEAIASAWDERAIDVSADAGTMVCLATGEKGTPALLHPSIKGVYGAQSAGASLVSFNTPAFESYGHDGEQGRNAPVAEKTAQAYGLALNYLLSDRSHHIRMGDTTVVFWAEHADKGNADLFSLLLGGSIQSTTADGTTVDKNLESALGCIRTGKSVDLNGVDLGSTFYVLGLVPNNARLSVRFFMRGEFGDMLGNLAAHYRRIEVARDGNGRFALSPYWLLRAVENPESKKPVVSSVLSAPLLKAILSGSRYPEGLYSNALLRVKATREVSYAQAAIIKGYLIRNCGRSEEEVTVELNEERNSVAYDLGRAFAYLGQIQEAANRKDTLTGSYLNSACTRPAVVFPTLLKLSTSHLQKLSKDKPGWAISLEKGLSAVLPEERVASFPKRLSLPEQGDFMLGFYHQKARRYQKKSSEPAADAADDAKEA